MELEKLEAVLSQQKSQLAAQLLTKERLEVSLKQTQEAVEQLRGAVAAIEYIVKESQPTAEDSQ